MRTCRDNLLFKQLLLMAALVLCITQVAAGQHLHEPADAACSVCIVSDDLQTLTTGAATPTPSPAALESAALAGSMPAVARRSPAQPRASPSTR